MSKDKAQRLYHKYKAHSVDVKEDEELKQLKKVEMGGQKRLSLLREKEECRRRVAILAVEEVDAEFERRREVFEDRTALLDFAQNVLPVIKLALWLRLTNFCHTKNIELADALQTAMGSQVDYEEVREAYKKEGHDYLLDDHLCLRIEGWLSQQQDEEQEEEDSGEESPSIIVEERVHSSEWADLQGFTHITIQKTREKYHRIPLPRANEDSE